MTHCYSFIDKNNGKFLINEVKPWYAGVHKDYPIDKKRKRKKKKKKKTPPSMSLKLRPIGLRILERFSLPKKSTEFSKNFNFNSFK